MTQDEIIEMARQAGGQVTMWVNQSTIQKTTTFTFESPIDYYVSGEYPEKYHIKFLERFAKLVAAKEREACAKVCYELPAPDIYSNTDKSMWGVTCIDCADAIRARGQA
jgi:hypothetical protein